jgi:hypothetical protein
MFEDSTGDGKRGDGISSERTDTFSSFGLRLQPYEVDVNVHPFKQMDCRPVKSDLDG